MELKEIMLSDMTNKQEKGKVGFNHQVRVFELLLSRYLKGIETDEVKYLSIYCIAGIPDISIDDYTIENGLTVQIPYDPIAFLNCKTTEDKYREFVRILQEYVAPVFQKKNWDFTPVDEALNKLPGHNYQAEFLLKGTPKKSPDKDHTAVVVSIHTTLSFKLVGKIYHKNGLLVKQEVLVEDIPTDMFYRMYLGKPSWKDPTTFQVSSETSQWVVKIEVD